MSSSLERLRLSDEIIEDADGSQADGKPAVVADRKRATASRPRASAPAEAAKPRGPAEAAKPRGPAEAAKPRGASAAKAAPKWLSSKSSAAVSRITLDEELEHGTPEDGNDDDDYDDDDYDDDDYDDDDYDDDASADDGIVAGEAVAPARQARPKRSPLKGIGGPIARNAVAVVLALAAAALAVGLVLTVMQSGDKSDLAIARFEALQAGKTYAVEIGGYDYRHLDQDFGVVLAHSTPSFKTSFTQSSNALKTTLLRFHATATAKVVRAGIEAATTTKAVILVFLTQTVTNSTQKQPTTDRSQLEITLVRTNGTWLIDNVSLL